MNEKAFSKNQRDILSRAGNGFTEVTSNRESLTSLVNLDTWVSNEDLVGLYRQNEATAQLIKDSLVRESTDLRIIRKAILPRLKESTDIPNAGFYRAREKDLDRILSNLLFNGDVEACDGTRATHDALPVTINQIGVSLVSYSGERGAWVHRLFRRDYSERMLDPAEAAFELLEKRQRRDAQGIDGEDPLSRLASRGIMTFAERAILREKSTALWRMGHGSPLPYEILTGFWASNLHNLQQSLDLINWYVKEYKRFIFVPSSPKKRDMLTLANALGPKQYILIGSMQRDIEELIENGGYTAVGTRKAMRQFAQSTASQIVIGAYRVWEQAPPYLFYAHVDYAHIAAHIAIADGLLQFHRGFPMLLDLADAVCTANFDTSTFTTTVQEAYTEAGEPFRYLGERETRRM